MNCLPDVNLNGIASMTYSDFCELVESHKERLETCWSRVDIYHMTQQHSESVEAVRREKKLRDMIEKSAQSRFKETWNPVVSRFPHLYEFVGQLAIVFPGITQVESYFSVLKKEKDAHRTDLTDSSLAGILHTKQFHTVQR